MSFQLTEAKRTRFDSSRSLGRTSQTTFRSQFPSRHASTHLESVEGVPESEVDGAYWVNLAFQQDLEFASEMINEYEIWDLVDDWYTKRNNL